MASDKLYNLADGTYFRITGPVKIPMESREYHDGRVLRLGNIDGMFSYCTDLDGNVYHPAAWTEVEVVAEPS